MDALVSRILPPMRLVGASRKTIDSYAQAAPVRYSCGFIFAAASAARLRIASRTAMPGEGVGFPSRPHTSANAGSIPAPGTDMDMETDTDVATSERLTERARRSHY